MRDHDRDHEELQDSEGPAGQVTDQAAEGGTPSDGPAAGADRRAFLTGGLAASAAAAGLWACKKAGDTSARKGEVPPSDPPAEMAPPKRRGPAPRAEAMDAMGASPREATARPARSTPAGEGARPAPRPAGAKARVVQVVNAKAYDAKGAPDGKPVKAMVDTAVMTLTGKDTPEAAWKSLFKPTDKVGLKPNCLGRQLCWPHPATVDAIIEGLLLAGVPYGQMVMWDMWGFGASPLATRYRKSPMKVKPIKVWGFERRSHKIASGGPVKFTKALTGLDAVVNIPVIKDHDLAGVTCALKNMAFGSIPNPWAFHANRSGERMCDPMVPEIYALPPIKDKVRLILADAFNIIIDGGPKGNPRGLRKLHSVFAATDPVAMDRTAWTIIDRLREQAKWPKLEEKSGGRSKPKYVLTAERMGLGTADPARIEHIVKTLG